MVNLFLGGACLVFVHERLLPSRQKTLIKDRRNILSHYYNGVIFNKEFSQVNLMAINYPL